MHRKHYSSYENHTSLDSEASPGRAELLAGKSDAPRPVHDLGGKRPAEFGRRALEQAAADVGEAGLHGVRRRPRRSRR